jgi:Cu-Zn family superoxide dismutase
MRILVASLLAIAAAIFAFTSAAFAQTPTATAQVRDANGRVVGTATFAEIADGVQVSGTFTGLMAGDHGIHIHAVGQCDPPGFTTAGGHFNPHGRQHGLQNPQGAHAGDLPNLAVAANGTGRITAVAQGATLGSGDGSLFDADGSALVIHAGPDDAVSDPAGNSGARVACGVITLASVPVGLPRAGGLDAVAPALAGLGALGAGALLRRRAAR